MNKYFDTEFLSEQDEVDCFNALIDYMFYLPPEVLRHPAVKARPYKVFSGEDAYQYINLIRQVKKDITVNGDMPLEIIRHAKAVAISERNYSGIEHIVYKLWNTSHPPRR